ncbi:MAG TPA: EamA family transporter [Rhodanobacteraceae bacterium]|nr:EamA family transporter [Rhodanobacteraceae bacterium]
MLLIIETLGQVALKMAGRAVGAFELNAASIHLAVATPWLWIALGCYCGGFAAWMVILEKSSLSIAFPTSAIVFVTVMLASWAIFGEAMGWEKILGSVVIVAGILLLGGESGAQPPPGNGDDAGGMHR